MFERKYLMLSGWLEVDCDHLVHLEIQPRVHMATSVGNEERKSELGNGTFYPPSLLLMLNMNSSGGCEWVCVWVEGRESKPGLRSFTCLVTMSQIAAVPCCNIMWVCFMVHEEKITWFGVCMCGMNVLLLESLGYISTESFVEQVISPQPALPSCRRHCHHTLSVYVYSCWTRSAPAVSQMEDLVWHYSWFSMRLHRCNCQLPEQLFL